MNKKALFSLALTLVLLFACLFWYTQARSFWDAAGIDPEEVTSLSALATETSVTNGQSQSTTWVLNDLTPGDEVYEALTALLDSSTYQPRLSNLLFPPSEVDAEGQYWISLNFAVDGGQSQVYLPASSTIQVTGGGGSHYPRYNASDPGLQGAVFQLIQEHGALS